jgi:hypothetical protein
MELIMTTKALVLAGIAAALLAVPAIAHHSYAMFDQSKVIQLSGTVKQYELINPHAWLHLTVVNDKGDPAAWTFEGGSSTQMVRLGWTKEIVKAGDKVEIGFRPMRDGSRGGQLMTIKFADGKKICSHRGCGDGTGTMLAD